jgi:hypothetical protein
VSECGRAKAAHLSEVFTCLSEEDQVAVLCPKLCLLVFGRNPIPHKIQQVRHSEIETEPLIYKCANRITYK